MKQRILSLQELYKQGLALLEKAEIADAQTDAWLLLEYVTGISRVTYYGSLQKQVQEDAVERYLQCIERRAGKIPLQHITGKQEFMGYTFHVDSSVLIPRQDTEVLVEEAIQNVRPDMHILDMCTGSGCILISLLKYAADRRQVKGLLGTGADICEKALLVAAKNAEQLQVEATFVRSDLFQMLEGNTDQFDLIISNPPYIRTSVIEELEAEVKYHDPYIALDGKEDGLYFYQRIVCDSVRFLAKGGYLMFEVGHDQGEAVLALMERAGFEEIQIKKDLAGLDRVVSGRYNKA